ncbi:uncharacterized protein LOC128659218 [Bombina bombina]|uniref:uncharacterized protein LOC128659218 n=1 Tax=Bombina bombina TaxID=8345 RepID=UPI00235A5266|nr:uncharacterized protein LOC128659218 [Bombina bombina]
MPDCFVNGCPSTTRRGKSNPAVSLHVFPRSVDRIRQWLKQTKQYEDKLEEVVKLVFETKRYRMCSLHFTEDSYYTHGVRKYLKDDALPTRFIHVAVSTPFPSTFSTTKRSTLSQFHKPSTSMKAPDVPAKAPDVPATSATIQEDVPIKKIKLSPILPIIRPKVMTPAETTNLQVLQMSHIRSIPILKGIEKCYVCGRCSSKQMIDTSTMTELKITEDKSTDFDRFYSTLTAKIQTGKMLGLKNKSTSTSDFLRKSDKYTWTMGDVSLDPHLSISTIDIKSLHKQSTNSTDRRTTSTSSVIAIDKESSIDKGIKIAEESDISLIKNIEKDPHDPSFIRDTTAESEEDFSQVEEATPEGFPVVVPERLEIKKEKPDMEYNATTIKRETGTFTADGFAVFAPEIIKVKSETEEPDTRDHLPTIKTENVTPTVTSPESITMKSETEEPESEDHVTTMQTENATPAAGGFPLCALGTLEVKTEKEDLDIDDRVTAIKIENVTTTVDGFRVVIVENLQVKAEQEDPYTEGETNTFPVDAPGNGNVKTDEEERDTEDHVTTINNIAISIEEKRSQTMLFDLWDPIAGCEESSGINASVFRMEGVSVDVEERVGNTDWCVCGNCQAMPTTHESICCRDVENVYSKIPDGSSCICEDPYVSISLTSRQYLVQVYRLLASYKKIPNNPNERDLQKISYRCFMVFAHGYLGLRHRKTIPSCVVSTIRKSFPAPDRIYVGSYAAEEDGPAINMLLD